MKLSLAVFHLHIASRLKKNKVPARHSRGGGWGIKVCLGCLLYRRFHVPVSFLNLF